MVGLWLELKLTGGLGGANVISSAHPSRPCSPSSLLRLLHWPSGWPSAEGDRVEPAEGLIEPGQSAAEFSVGFEEEGWCLRTSSPSSDLLCWEVALSGP